MGFTDPKNPDKGGLSRKERTGEGGVREGGKGLKRVRPGGRGVEGD